MRCRAMLLLALAASLALSGSPAGAKGNIPMRSYAVITGPGLSHPIVFVAPWKKSRGGFYTGEGEIFLGLAGQTGALPAGKLYTDAGNYVPDGVLPIDEVPSDAARGPRYRLTWFRDGLKVVAKQNVYPYAPAGPLVYTLPSSRRSLILLFGRFQAPAHLWTGWGRATSFDLLMFLRANGLPTLPPAVRGDSGKASPSTSPTTSSSAVPAATVALASQPTRLPPIAASALILLAVLSIVVLWVRRRRREMHVIAHAMGSFDSSHTDG